MCSAAREVKFDILHRIVRAGRNGNKHAMAPTCQGVLVVAAAAALAAAVAAVAATNAAVAAVPLSSRKSGKFSRPFFMVL